MARAPSLRRTTTSAGPRLDRISTSGCSRIKSAQLTVHRRAGLQPCACCALFRSSSPAARMVARPCALLLPLGAVFNTRAANEVTQRACHWSLPGQNYCTRAVKQASMPKRGSVRARVKQSLCFTSRASPVFLTPTTSAIMIRTAQSCWLQCPLGLPAVRPMLRPFTSAFARHPAPSSAFAAIYRKNERMLCQASFFDIAWGVTGDVSAQARRRIAFVSPRSCSTGKC